MDFSRTLILEKQRGMILESDNYTAKLIIISVDNEMIKKNSQCCVGDYSIRTFPTETTVFFLITFLFLGNSIM